MKEDLSLGLDIGKASTGWALLDMSKKEMIDFGVHLFNTAAPAQNARLNRGSRRNLRRRKWRKKQLKQAFIDFGLLTKQDFEIPGFLSFTANNEFVSRPKDETVYHLQCRALHEEITTRELAMCLYNICGTRGHFLMETIDFSNDSISFSTFKEKFYDLLNKFVDFDFNLVEFESNILEPVFNKQLFKANQVNSLFNRGISNTKQEDEILLQSLLLLIGRKADLSKIDESVILPDVSGKVDVIDLLKRDELNDFLNGIVELHDLIEVSNILKEANYICEYNVQKLDKVKEIYKLEKTDPKAYKDAKKSIQDFMSSTGKTKNRLRVVKNMQNKYPNGMYVKEVSAILHKQQEYNPKITDEFIEVCVEIIKARIPYYIGPLSNDAKNAWLVKTSDEPFKYSYDYSMRKFGLINEFETIRAWKRAMISHCTYLPEETALPKGSFLAETFSICNEINILHALDQDGNEYYLTLEDKVKLFDSLFLKKESVTYKDICDTLNLSYFGARNSKYTTKFNNKYTLYHRIRKIMPELQFDAITDIFLDTEKVNRLEDVILNINLFDEELSRRNYFEHEMKLDDRVATALAKLQIKGFYSFSRKFIAETPMNVEGQTLLEELFDDNTSEFVNEQMTRISQATDLDGNPVHFDSNKYINKIKENGGHLSVDLLIDGGKPFIPISRPVIRTLNECFKLYEEVIHTYGVPKRVVIETARDFNDKGNEKKIHTSYAEEMKKFYDDLQIQIQQSEKKGKHIHTDIEDWDQLKKYVSANKKKLWLYLRQNGRDMVSGDPIDLNDLSQYEIDHILPRGFGDNSMDNLMLIHKDYNSKKSNRLPLEFIEQDHPVNRKGQVITSSDFVRRCNELLDLKLISERKVERLLLKNTEDALGFINRDLVDTRYIIREFMAILRAYNQVNGYDTHIVALKASFTSVYRNAFKIKKNRGVGDQHHAYDALTVSLADQCLSTIYPNYDSRGNQKQYKEFIEDLKKAFVADDNISSSSKLYRDICYAYKKTFNNYPNEYESIVSVAKRTTPLYSVKVEKKAQGEFFNATLYSPKKDTKDVLTILGVNNDKRSFSSINCAAVDFYKYTTSKGKKKHVAVHIPKVIVDSKGRINEEKYKKLITDVYKEPDLLDENGNIKTYYFRMRVYKNDLIYDTNNQTIQLFNIGSIANSKLEMKHVNCFAIDEIERRVQFYRKELAREFDFKMPKINPNGTKKPSDVSVEVLAEYGVDHLMDVEDMGRYRKTLLSNLANIKTYPEFLETMAFLDIVVNRKCTPPTITGQYKPTISSVGEEAQYIKIKSSILGIRWQYNDQGKLMISGPRGHREKFSKIKKENFSWEV